MAKGTTAYERIARRQARAARRSKVSQVKASEELSFNELIERMAASSRTFSSISVNPSNAMRCTTVQGIVRAMTNAIGTYPARVVRAVDGEGGEVIETAPKHPVNMVLRRPNPIQTQAEFFRMVMQHTLLWGNFYALKGQGQTGPLQFLRPIEDPDAVSLDSLNWGRGAVFRVSTGTEPQKFVSGSQIFRATSGILGDDGVTGVSPVRLAAKAIAVCIAAEQLIGEMYVNNDMPTMALTGGEFRDREAYELWEQKFREARGAIGEGRGGTLLLPKGMEPKEMSFRPIDAQLLEMRKFQRIEIAQVYGVPPHKLADLERATFCLPAGTLVYTAVGPKPIEEIERGEAVWSYGDGEWRRRLVTRAGCTGEDEILKIRTGNRTLRANARHRVLARRKYAMPSAGRGKYQSVEWRTEYVPAGELKVGDTVVAFNGLHACQSFDDEARSYAYLPCRVSDDQAALFGLILGDGNVYPNWGVSIARAKDALYMDYYRDVIVRTFRRYDGGNGRGDQTVVKLAPVTLTEDERQTKFASVQAARLLRDFGLCGTARTKRVPEWVMASPERTRLAFLRGFLDADGSVDKKGRVSFSSCSEIMLAQIRYLCMSCAIPVTNMRHQIGETTLPDGRRCRVSQWAFTCSDPGSNRRIGSHDPRYVARMMAGKPFGRKAGRYPHSGGRGFDMRGCSLSRITAIERQPAEPVYDLEVEETHNFVADGIVVHNSNIEEQSLEFVRDTSRPAIMLLQQAARRDLLSPEDRRNGYEVLFDMEAATEGRLKDRLEAYGKAVEIGAMSPNEVRRRLGMNPRADDGGDEYMTPLNMRTTSDESQQSDTQDQAAGGEGAGMGAGRPRRPVRAV